MRKAHDGSKRSEEDEPVNLSKTQFITYLSCGKQYYWKYFKGYKEPGDKENFLKGNAVHDFFENMYDDHVEVDEENCEIEIDHSTLSKKQLQYMDLLRNIVEFEENRMQDVKEKGLDLNKYFYPVSQEERIEVPGMRGLPDAIYRREDGTLEVLDLKSSLYSGWKHKYEALFYAKLIDKSDEFDKPVTAGIMLDASGPDTRYYDFDKWDLMEFDKYLRNIRKGIRNRKFEPCGKNWCNWDTTPPEEAERERSNIRR